ncbi:RNA 2',3'-cyclic phosphodiesterase [uncultured Pontibacter sp.]|uniref:RNA 2',3'-cyclic phosphodiesterase n=1 Tax=uncultured Pontibacter sp. TaxID=453356 RepID=UPI002602E7BD|nr:RNA 2',3'-cyclic phosphodiesterase [uncultured Pontibacter sp.]
MKDTIRLFLAAILPEALKEKLQEQLQAFEHSHTKFIPKQNLHLTLYFIGNVPLAQLESIKQVVEEIAKHHQPFTLRYAQTEPGPHQRKPRLIWARFEPDAAFESLSKQLTLKLSDQPNPVLKPLPHVTLARFRKDKPAPKDLPVITSEEPLELHVNGIALWQSELASPHPVYTVIDAYPLG